MSISTTSCAARRPTPAYWLWPIVAGVATYLLLFWLWRDAAAWQVMWLMAGAVFVGCKLATLAEVAEAQRLSGRSSFAYVFAWPGLDARSFLMGDDRTAGRPRGGEWGFVFVNTMFGAAMFWGVARFLPIENNLAIGWTGMIGLIFVLHFGLLHAAALSWRATGMSVEPIMDWPIRATSLAEFWGQRWNRAFRDFAHRFVFRPLAARWGVRAATWAVFVFSGVSHEIVISLPAGGGFGLPTLYFLLQGVGLFVEKSHWGRSHGLGRGITGWLFSCLVICGPAFWLFHPPFVRGVIVPMMHAFGSL